jgi:uncharacterized protein (DUF2062 family)
MCGYDYRRLSHFILPKFLLLFFPHLAMIIDPETGEQKSEWSAVHTGFIVGGTLIGFIIMVCIVYGIIQCRRKVLREREREAVAVDESETQK